MSTAETRHRFTVLVRQSPGDFRLAEGALLIAQEEYPGLDVAHYLQHLDTMAEAIRQYPRAGARPTPYCGLHQRVSV